MPATSPDRLALSALLIALPLTGRQLAAQQPDLADPAARMAAYERHVAMAAASPLGAVRWQFLGPKNISGRVTDIAVRTPRGKSYTMYVAGASGGVWKTENEGVTWEPVFEHAASTSIGDVTLAPSNQDTVWIGTGEANIFRSSMAGCGVYKSTDDGKTWQHMGLTGTQTIARIVIHPKDENTVYVAASGHEWTDNEERGVYKTTDGGKTWDKVLYIDAKTGAIDLVMHPTEPDTLYAATWQRIRKRWHDPRNDDTSRGSGIHKTTDGGKTWTPCNEGLPAAQFRGRIGIDLCRTKPETVYAFVDNYELAEQQISGRDSYGRARGKTIKGATVFRSDDGGQRWRQVSENSNYMRRLSSTYGWVFGQVRVDPNDAETVYVMGLGLNVSKDGGKTFRFTSRGVHGDHHALWIDPDNSDYLVNGNDGGVVISYDGGRRWRQFLDNLPMVQFFNVNYDMATPFRVYGSIQDHGSRRAVVDVRNRRRIPAQSWENAPGGEGSHHFIDPTDANTVYSASFYGRISRSDLRRGRRGKTLKLEAPTDGPALRGQWLAPFILSPHDPNVLYHGMNYLFRSENRGDDMQVISADLSYNDAKSMGDIPYHTISSISESPLKKGLLYVGTDDGRVWLKDGEGARFEEITDGATPHRWVSRIIASRYTEGTVYMAQNGKRHDDFTPYLWKSTDNGRTWRSIVANIPLGPINVIREDPKEEDILYVGTDLGVYVTIDGAKTWHALPNRLPTTFVSDLIVHPRDDVIVISTHGRGMYAMDGQRLRREIAKVRAK